MALHNYMALCVKKKGAQLEWAHGNSFETFWFFSGTFLGQDHFGNDPDTYLCLRPVLK